MSDHHLRGRILGFEDYAKYTIEAAFGDSSPFRLISSAEAPISFVAVNPYEIVEDYSFEIEDGTLKELFGHEDWLDDVAVLCLVRPNDTTLYVNLRSPLIINTKKGIFTQTILQSEAYAVSFPFALRKKAE